jgi:hypothetical protein
MTTAQVQRLSLQIAFFTLQPTGGLSCDARAICSSFVNRALASLGLGNSSIDRQAPWWSLKDSTTNLAPRSTTRYLTLGISEYGIRSVIRKGVLVGFPRLSTSALKQPAPNLASFRIQQPNGIGLGSPRDFNVANDAGENLPGIVDVFGVEATTPQNDNVRGPILRRDEFVTPWCHRAGTMAQAIPHGKLMVDESHENKKAPPEL